MSASVVATGPGSTSVDCLELGPGTDTAGVGLEPVGAGLAGSRVGCLAVDGRGTVAPVPRVDMGIIYSLLVESRNKSSQN